MLLSVNSKFLFTFNILEGYFRKALDLGYDIITCSAYAKNQKKLTRPTLVNRIDIDFSCKKAKRIVEIFDELGIHGTFCLRLHAPEYNPFDFENYKIIKSLLANENELAYHSEIIDQAAIWGETPADCLKRDIKVIESMFNTNVQGVASHGGFTGLNNLDFWENNSPSDFGLLYEAYDESETFGLFSNSFYISDSEWTRWKCYDQGLLREGDNRTLGEHLDSGHDLIYSLIHSDTYFEDHFYE